MYFLRGTGFAYRGLAGPIVERTRSRRGSTINGSIETMEVKDFDSLYVNGLRDLYSAEKQLIKALPKVAKAATTPKLKNAIEKHLEVTKGQVERLDTIFKDLKESPEGH